MEIEWGERREGKDPYLCLSHIGVSQTNVGREQKWKFHAGSVHYLGPLAQKIFSVSDSDPIPELKALSVAQIHTIKAVKNTNPQYTRTMCE